MSQTNGKKMHDDVLKTKTLWLIAASYISTIKSNTIIQILGETLNAAPNPALQLNIDEHGPAKPLFVIIDPRTA